MIYTRHYIGMNDLKGHFVPPIADVPVKSSLQEQTFYLPDVKTIFI